MNTIRIHHLIPQFTPYTTFKHSSANDFYDTFNFCFEKNKYSQAAFLLHQVTERLYNCILLVFTRYKPKTHDLEELRSFVNTLDQRFIRVFSITIPEENRLFNLLCKAYVDARYNQNYRITQNELSWLAKKVQELTHLTETLCQEKINSFLEAAKSESKNQSDIA